MNTRQAIGASADGILTAWRPYKNIDPLQKNDNDNVMSMWLCVNRWGQEDIIRNYNYYGDRRLVKGIYEGSVQQTPAITYEG